MISAEGCSSSRQDKDRRPVKRTPRENIHPCACTARTQVTGQCSMWSNPPPPPGKQSKISVVSYVLVYLHQEKESCLPRKKKEKRRPVLCERQPQRPSPKFIHSSSQAHFKVEQRSPESLLVFKISLGFCRSLDFV